MQVSIDEAGDPLAHLIRAAAEGESVIITRDGEAIAQIAPPPRARRPVQFDGMRDRIKLFPGWDDPVDLEFFLAGDL